MIRFSRLRARLLCACAVSVSAIPAQAASPQSAAAEVREEIIVTAPSERPTSQVVTTIDQSVFENSPAFSIGQVLQYSPGVTIKQGNGPRDVGISIRGSNARNGFGVRNIQVFEDGFPVTQPDGLSRTDLTDPHAYAGIDVTRGPSSALYGNYATGGAVNFHTRTGSSIDGVEVGSDAGAFGYFNEYALAGQKIGGFEYSVFVSHVRGEGRISTSDFNTTTVNLLASYSPSPEDKITVKFINNDLSAHLSTRLSLNQYHQNPFQEGCTVAATATLGCGTIALFRNGFAGATQAQTSAEAGLGRNDRRTVVGARWEHAFSDDTTWRNQFVWDVKDIKQPTGATSAQGATPSFSTSSDVTITGQAFGLAATHFAGVFLNYLDINGSTFNVMPGGKATLGALTAANSGSIVNYGGRLREEVALAPAWRLIAGLGAEASKLDSRNTTYAYASTTPTSTILDAKRSFFNVAPEVALMFEPTEAWSVKTRFGMGYGIPQPGNLFVTPAGTSGNNTALKPQSNMGFDLGADWMPLDSLMIGVSGFYELLRNEFVTQSPGAGLLSYTFNAPRSEHRGFEVVSSWKPVEGFAATLSYTFNDQIYTSYIEQLSAGTRTATFDRANNKIPGVEPHNLSTRFAYDVPAGALKGLGGFVEMNFRDRFYVDNANSVQAPDYTLINLNLHYDFEGSGALRSGRLFLEAQNLMDRTYVASANNVSNSLNATTGLLNPASVVRAATGSIYAGQRRTVVGGMKLKF